MTAARILLLEDSDIDADLLLAFVQRGPARFTVERAVRRSEFEGALQRPAPDLVLADYSLPDFDGLAALRLTQTHWPGVPFIFISGVQGEDVAMQALRAGATDYVLKRNMPGLRTAIDRALAEARERRSRERAELLFMLATQAADIGVWELAADAQSVWFDDGLRRRLGLGEQAEWPLATLLQQVVHPDDRAPLNAALHDGEVDITCRVLPRGGGGTVWLAMKGRHSMGPGSQTRMVGTARDVTDERRRDEALRDANRALEERIEERTRERDRMWNHSADLMHVCRPDGTLVAANPAWQRLLGWAPEQIVGRNFADLLHADDRAAALASLAASTVADSGAPALDTRVRRADQRTDRQQRWVRWTNSGDARHVYGVGRDITEERAATLALAATNRELQDQVAERSRVEATLQQMQRLEAVGQLTSGVAHDFNNLLAVVLSNISLIRLLLQRQPGAADVRLLQRLDAMQRASERGGKLVTQLLAFSRRQRLEPTVLNLNDVVQSMRDLLQTTMGGTVRIDTELQADLWPALADATQLELIVLNLAINARDAMDVGGSLTVRTRNTTLQAAPLRPEEPEPGEYVQLTVADTGSGIAPAVLAKVFEPFFTTKELGRGSGLGLAQVYGFAKQSGGGVRIDTALGSGTAVHVFVPRAAGDATALQPAVPVHTSSTAVTSDAYQLLLVDDDDAVRDVTAELMGHMGYRVLQAASGAEALAVAERGVDIDLVLADFAMPGLNGAELRRQLQQKKPGLPVIILTGYADLAALRDVPEDMVLHKPVLDNQLEERLKLLLPQRG